MSRISPFRKALNTLGIAMLFRGVTTYPQRVYPGGGVSAGDIRLDAMGAMSLSSVFACIRIISNTMAMIPLNVYKRQGDDNRKLYPDHPVYKLIHDRPNPYMSAARFWQMAYAHILGWGNHFSLIDWVGSSDNADPVALWPLEPSRVTIVMQPDGSVSYEYRAADGVKTYAAEDILHLMFFSVDGINGLTPIEVCRMTLGMSIVAERYGAALFRNGGRPSGVLQVPETLSDEGMKHLRESWEALHTGTDNMGRVAILEEGTTYSAITIKPDDAQFLQTRRFQVQEIARIYGVPPHLIQEIEQPTYASVEAQKDEFLSFTLQPHMVFTEQAINLRFFGGNTARYTASYDFNRFLRTDIKQRYESYAIGRNWGWLTINDVLKFEGMNTIGPEGDIRIIPLNMTPSAGVRTPAPSDTVEVGPGQGPNPKPTIPPKPTPGQPPKPPKPNGGAIQ